MFDKNHLPAALAFLRSATYFALGFSDARRLKAAGVVESGDFQEVASGKTQGLRVNA
jgi:hypothetical protein